MLYEVVSGSDGFSAFFLLASVGKIFGNKEMRLLMLGLDAAGKTSKFPLIWLGGALNNVRLASDSL
jgi:hypothetical protein